MSTSSTLCCLCLVTTIASGPLQARASTVLRVSKEPVLLVSPSAGTVEVVVAGLVLERLPLRDAALLTNRNIERPSPMDGELAPPGVFVVASPPAPATRATITAAPPPPGLQPAPAPPADGGLSVERLESGAPTHSYDTDLEGGWGLKVTTGSARPSFTRRVLETLVARGHGLRGLETPQRSGWLVLAVDSTVAERLVSLLRPGTRIAVGAATGVGLPATGALPADGETRPSPQ